MTDMLPYEFERLGADHDFVRTVATLPPTASYSTIDGYDLALAKAGSGGDRTSREDFEVQMHYLRWRVAGRNSFVIGPETAARIMERLKGGDVPTAPVPPVYIHFENPPCNFAASRPLDAAFLSRGVVGRITFITGVPGASRHVDHAVTTVLLPSVFRNRDVEHLKRGMAACRDRPPSKEAGSLARSMARSMGDMDDEAIDLLAGHLGSIGDSLRPDHEPGIDLSAAIVDRSFGRLPGRPNPLLPKAARIVLLAADEARRANADYARPTYLDGNQIERNWMETRDEPATVQTGPVRLS